MPSVMPAYGKCSNFSFTVLNAYPEVITVIEILDLRSWTINAAYSSVLGQLSSQRAEVFKHADEKYWGAFVLNSKNDSDDIAMVSQKLSGKTKIV